MANAPHKVGWRLRLSFAAISGAVIGFLTGAAAGQAAAFGLGWSAFGPPDSHAALAGGVVGALAGALSGIIAADS